MTAPLDEASLIIDSAMREHWLRASPPDSASRAERSAMQRVRFNAGEEASYTEAEPRLFAVGGPLDGELLSARDVRACGCADLPTAFRHPSGAVYALTYSVEVDDGDR